MAKNNIRVTVYGGTNNKSYSDYEKSQCEKLGEYLGSIGAEIKTGGCYGYPYFVGKAAIGAGAKRVIGRSPGMDEKEHTEKFGYPMDGVTEMVYTTKKYPTEAESLLVRMQEKQSFSDVVIALGGSWGTYYELILSLWYKKTVIIVEEFGGAGEAFINTYNFFGARDVNPKVHEGVKIISVRTVDKAIQEMAKLIT